MPTLVIGNAEGIRDWIDTLFQTREESQEPLSDEEREERRRREEEERILL